MSSYLKKIINTKARPSPLHPSARTANTRMVYLEQMDTPAVTIMPIALAKMARYVGLCSEEIGWMGTVEFLPGSDADNTVDTYMISDVFLFKQEVHATTTEITPEGLSDFVMSKINEPGGMDLLQKLNLWGHSHVNMGVSPSGQDDSQMDVFRANVMETDRQFMIRLIANKKGEVRVDVYDYRAGVAFMEVDWEIAENFDEIDEEVKTQMVELVSAKTYAPATTTARPGLAYSEFLQKKQMEANLALGFEEDDEDEDKKKGKIRKKRDGLSSYRDLVSGPRGFLDEDVDSGDTNPLKDWDSKWTPYSDE